MKRIIYSDRLNRKDGFLCLDCVGNALGKFQILGSGNKEPIHSVIVRLNPNITRNSSPNPAHIYPGYLLRSEFIHY